MRDENGKVSTVRYEAVNAMLLNEFLKEHQKVEERGATIAQMKKQIEALTATVQKVSDQLARSKPAPQLVATLKVAGCRLRNALLSDRETSYNWSQ